MATNVFFNNYNSYAEQNLIEDLIIESIRIYGIDLYYCPRTLVEVDNTFGEDTLNKYNDHYLIEMYVKNVEGFEGEGDFLSRFNIQIRDEITFTVSRRVWNTDIGTIQLLDRPNEGDIIYFPLTGKIYVVKFVEHESIFYQMGSLQVYDLRCELFEYSNEILNTGIGDIDEIATDYSLNVANSMTKDANGDILINANTGRPFVNSTIYDSGFDSIADNRDVESEANTYIDFSETDPFSEGNF